MIVGILTRRYGHNMGSTLQAYAISELIKELGHNPEIIDYDESSTHLIWKLRPLMDHSLYPFRRLLPDEKSGYLCHRHEQEKRFKKFEHDYLPLSKQHIFSARGLKLLASRYDKIVLGSDQIWSPFLFDPNYYGEFISPQQRNRIIAYAPSLGTSKEELLFPRQKELIRNLSVISCREEVGAYILGKVTNREIPVVLDPTLMINAKKWVEIANGHIVEGIPSQYILTYFLGSNIPQKAIARIKQQENLKTVNVSMFNKPNDLCADIHAKNIGPGEFLYLIKNASYILTDSFHGTIFSWIFQRPFTVFSRFLSTDKQNQNSRIDTLLKILGTQSHLFPGNVGNGQCFYELVRKRSIEFLSESLNNEA